MTRSTRYLFPAFALASVLLTACGGGGGGGDSTAPPGGPGSGVDRFHVMFSGFGPSGTVSLVNPLDPTNPVLVSGVTQQGFAFHAIIDGTPDLAAGVLRDVRVDRAVFTSGNAVRELMLTSASGTPVPRTVQTFGAEVQDVEAELDFSGASRTIVYTVELSGGSHVTFDQSGTAATTPLPFPGVPVTATLDRATGAIDGWLALESGTLTHVSRGLISTNLTVASSADYIDQTAAGDAFLFLGDRFAAYRQDKTLAEVAFTPVANGAFGMSDFAVAGADALFFAAATGPGTFQIVRALADGTAAPVGGDISGFPSFLNVTDNRILVAFQDALNGGVSLQSSNLQGGDVVMIETSAAGIDAGFFSTPGSASGRVVYELVGVGVVDVEDDGTDRRVFQDAELVGLGLDGDLRIDSAPDLSTIYLATALPSGAIRLDGATPGDAASLRSYGEIPPGFSQVNALSLFANTAIVTAIDTQSGAPQADVFFLRNADADSLVRVTNTPEFEIGVL